MTGAISLYASMAYTETNSRLPLLELPGTHKSPLSADVSVLYENNLILAAR
jgi:hypothetical protein